MSDFYGVVAGALVMATSALFAIAKAIEKHARHLSNIADRLLDIDNTLNKRR